jgi:hypothetical protein
MKLLTELLNANRARLILANKRAATTDDRGREILEHAQDYLRLRAEDIGDEMQERD